MCRAEVEKEMNLRMSTIWNGEMREVKEKMERKVKSTIKTEFQASKRDMQEMCIHYLSEKMSAIGAGIQEKVEEICDRVMVEKIEENEKKRVLEEAEEVEGKKKKRNSKETGKLSTTL